MPSGETEVSRATLQGVLSNTDRLKKEGSQLLAQLSASSRKVEADADKTSQELAGALKDEIREALENTSLKLSGKAAAVSERLDKNTTRTAAAVDALVTRLDKYARGHEGLAAMIAAARKTIGTARGDLAWHPQARRKIEAAVRRDNETRTRALRNFVGAASAQLVRTLVERFDIESYSDFSDLSAR